MAQGDIQKGHASVASGASLTVQPGAGEAWAIHTIAGDHSGELHITNGTNSLLATTFAGETYTSAFVHRATNDVYLTIKNTSGVSGRYGYSGVETIATAGVPGDTVIDLAVVIASEVMDIRPPSGQAWMIDNLYFGGYYMLQLVDGSDNTMVVGANDTMIGDVALIGQRIELTHDWYLRIVNIDVDDHPYGYSGYRVV